MDKGLSCNVWFMGRILETFPDSFGHVRTVGILTKNSVLVRPVTTVALLTPASDES